VAATLAIAFAPVILLEGGLRLAGWPTARVRSFGKLLNFDGASWDASIGMFHPSSQATVLWPPELSYEVRINSLGLRGPEIERTPPPGRTRILAIGDSMTFGYYLEEDETWPARLQARLRDRGLDVEVVNAGCGGWTIDSETPFLLERGLALEPDRVLLAFYANDIGDLDVGGVMYEGQRATAHRGIAPLVKALYTSATYELYLRAQVAWKHWREVRSGEIAKRIVSADPPDDREPALWAAYADWLRRFHEPLAKRGIPLTLVFIPDAYKLIHGLPDPDEGRLRALAEANGIGFVSPLPDFVGGHYDELFQLPYDDHLGPKGADLVARKLAEALVEPAAAGR